MTIYGSIIKEVNDGIASVTFTVALAFPVVPANCPAAEIGDAQIFDLINQMDMPADAKPNISEVFK